MFSAEFYLLYDFIICLVSVFFKAILEMVGDRFLYFCIMLFQSSCFVQNAVELNQLQLQNLNPGYPVS